MALKFQGTLKRKVSPWYSDGTIIYSLYITNIELCMEY